MNERRRLTGLAFSWKGLQLTPRAWASRDVVPFSRRGLGAVALAVSARGAAEGRAVIRHFRETPMATIRTASPEDAAALFQLRASLRAEALPTLLRHDRIYSVSEEAAFLRTFAERENWIFLLAYDRSAVVGHLELSGGLHSQTRHVASLGMAVVEPFRGRGIGTEMFSTAKDWALRTGILRLELEVFESNSAAIRLYERLGFSRHGLRKGAIRTESGFESLVAMSCSLPENAV